MAESYFSKVSFLDARAATALLLRQARKTGLDPLSSVIVLVGHAPTEPIVSWNDAAATIFAVLKSKPAFQEQG